MPEKPVSEMEPCLLCGEPHGSGADVCDECCQEAKSRERVREEMRADLGDMDRAEARDRGAA